MRRQKIHDWWGPKSKDLGPIIVAANTKKSSSKNGLSHSWYKKEKSLFRSSFVGHLFKSCTTASIVLQGSNRTGDMKTKCKRALGGKIPPGPCICLLPACIRDFMGKSAYRFQSRSIHDFLNGSPKNSRAASKSMMTQSRALWASSVSGSSFKIRSAS